MSEAARRVLVTGGAGYIGSHVVRQLRTAGHEVVVIDDLSTGHDWALADADLIVADYGDPAAFARALERGPLDAVLHFAAHVSVAESVADPATYYRNNAVKSLRLFEACAAHRVGQIVFSSTAAVYGATTGEPVDESAPLAPANPYGASKMMAERMLIDVARPSRLRFVILRYFNVAGAAPEGHLGQATAGSAALIKVVCEAAAGQRDRVIIHGTDYATRDGTCVRDFIHVEDLAAAHVAALDHLIGGGEPAILNCGYGRGVSVRDVIDAGRRVTGVDFRVECGPRRPGDVAVVVADATRIRRLLDWTPAHDDLETIIGTAWRFERRRAGSGTAVGRRSPG